jgi:two-component system C4-dicarboxylate transport sensor histidine kinase DctB
MKLNKPLAFVSIILISLALLSTYFLAKKSASNKLQQGVEIQLQQLVNELEIVLERHAYLPALIADDQAIIDFMRLQAKPKNTENDESYDAQLSRINASLELTNNTSGASSVFLMRLDGTTVASSNWFTPHSFFGKNFSFRPYFQHAKQNILGRYYGVGAITGERGYFFARSIHNHQKVIGVVVVKIAMDDVEFTWGVGSMDFMVTDKQGVIFLSSQDRWNLHSLMSLSDEQNKQVLESRRYGTSKIQPLKNSILNLTKQSFQSISIDNTNYEMLTKNMILADWDVRVLANHSSMKQAISTTMLIASVLASLLTSLAIVLWRAQQQRKNYQLQITEELENKVAERTKALKQSQEDLIQAAKMAALGQLSAGITHEINNPLTAIRAYADNAQQFLKKDRLNMVESNLTEISHLTESMAAITKQLKSFSRKSKGQFMPVLLGQSINNALSIVHPKLVSSGVKCHWETSDHGVNKSVLADEVWLGQILVNLLTNAIAATQHLSRKNQQREIWISIKTNTDSQQADGSQLCIEVKDNGIGIEANTFPRIFEPFFTTKPSSKGLGLGLSISFNLAKDMNGSLIAKNEKIGASFMLCLPEAL